MRWSRRCTRGVATASWSITRIAACSTCRSATPSGCAMPASNPPLAASAIPTTTRWPKPSTGFTRPKSSIGDCWSRSGTSRQRKPKPTTIGKRLRCPWQRDSHPTASGKAGAVQFLAIAPDGTRYTFSHLVYRPMSSLQSPLGTAPAVNGPHPMVAPFNIINREEALMYVTKVEDRFGNTLTYNWNGNDLVSIVASDGRELDFSYGLSTPLVSTITLKSAGGAHARPWTYSYNTSGAAPTLTRLQLPDGSAWTYSLGSLQMAAFDTSFQNGSCPGTGQLDISGGGPATGNITAPS